MTPNVQILLGVGALTLVGCATGVDRSETPFGDSLTAGASGGGDTDGDSGVLPSEDSDGDSGQGSGASSDGGGDDGGSSGGPAKEPVCGDGIVDDGEACDGEAFPDDLSCQSLGYDSGVLVCAANCLGYEANGCYVCGNDQREEAEDCDGFVPSDITCESLGFEGGTVTCGGDCFYDTSDCSTCADGVANGFEACDGDDLGGEDCDSLGLGGGTLACNNDCTYDFTSCDIAGMQFGSDSGYTGFVLNPAVLPCDDISGTGTGTNLGDDISTTVSMGFNFPFYGTNFNQITIGSNGWLHLGAGSASSLSNSCLPTTTSPSDHNIYLMWDDLNPTIGSGEVRYQTLGAGGDRRFVVQYDIANYAGNTTDLMRFQAVLYEATGQLNVCYVDTINGGNSNDNGAESTSGIQLDGQTSIEFSCNTPSLTDGTMLLYIPN